MLYNVQCNDKLSIVKTRMLKLFSIIGLGGGLYIIFELFEKYSVRYWHYSI